MSREALTMALDLATMHHTDDGYAELRAKVRSATKEALAQPEQEHEREAFEAWALGTICYKEDLQRKGITGYGSQELNYLWRGWSAKAAHGIKENT